MWKPLNLKRRQLHTCSKAMAARRSCARALVSLLVLVSSICGCQAFHVVLSNRDSSRPSPTSTQRRLSPRCGQGFGRPRPLVPLPPRVAGKPRSSANNDGQGNEGGGSGGGRDEGSGLFGGLREWWKKEAKSDLMVYGTSLAVALTIRTVALEPRYIPSLSMFPTFEVGDQLAVDKLSAKLSRPYQRKDVVVFHPPPAFLEFSTRSTNEALIKRVIAVNGDTVQIKDGSLFVNGEEQFEQYTFEEPEYSWGPQTIPEGMVMVLGDNRNHSLDSHIWGFLPRENVIGRAIFKYWPPWRAGLVES